MKSTEGARTHHKEKDTGYSGLSPTVWGAIGLLIIVPLILYLVTPWFDTLLRALIGNWVDLFTLIASPWSFILAVSLCLIGYSYALWAFVSLYKTGKGSAVPFYPTKVLVAIGPYKYSRNPMVLGVIILYIGVGLLLRSTEMVILAFSFLIVPYMLYIRLVEEKGLIARFGEGYLKYKKETRFILPLPKRHPKP